MGASSVGTDRSGTMVHKRINERIEWDKIVWTAEGETCRDAISTVLPSWKRVA